LKTTDDKPSDAALRGPRVRPVPAVTRAIAILRLLGSQPAPLSLKAIAQELDMVTSTALHILRVLVDEKLVQVDTSTKRYRLGTGMLTLARSVVQANPFPTLVQPVLDRLSKAWNVTAIGVEVTGVDELVVLALSRSSAPFQLHVDVGSRFSAFTSATGRLVAAFNPMPPAELARRFKAAKWDQAPELETWLKEVEGVRKKGYSVDRGNYIGGITVIAVPLIDGAGRMQHALVGASIADQLTASRLADLAKDMKDEAQALTAMLNRGG
jgi:DNA-binding IclR family transcriptional regulator